MATNFGQLVQLKGHLRRQKCVLKLVLFGGRLSLLPSSGKGGLQMDYIGRKYLIFIELFKISQILDIP
jgi:hypothetical protein